MDKPVKPEPKKSYEPPRLIVYGTVRDLTQQTGARATLDGGTRPTVRTATH